MTHVVRPRMTVTMFSMYPEINLSIMYKLLMLGELSYKNEFCNMFQVVYISTKILKYMVRNKTIPLFLHRFDIRQGK